METKNLEQVGASHECSALCRECSIKDITIMHLEDTQAVSAGRIDALHELLVTQHNNRVEHQTKNGSQAAKIKELELSLAAVRGELSASYARAEMNLQQVLSKLHGELSTQTSQISNQFYLIKKLKAELAECRQEVLQE